MPNQRYPKERYREEIESILEEQERKQRRAERIRTVTTRVTVPRFVLSTGWLLWAGFAFLVLAFLARAMFVPFAATGALLLLIWYMAHFSRPGGRTGGRTEKRWRGEVVDYPDTLQNRVRRWRGGRDKK